MSDSNDLAELRVWMHHSLDEEGLRRLPDLLNAKRNEIDPAVITARLNMIAQPEQKPIGVFSFLQPSSGKPPLVMKEEINWRVDNFGEPFAKFTKWIFGKLEGDNPIVDIKCTSALWLLISPRMLQLGSWLLWHDFITTAKLRQAMRTIVASVATSVGAEEALYVADYESAAGTAACNDFFEGRNYDETKEHLRGIAPDAERDIESLLKNATPTATLFKGVYLIDSFKDNANG